MRRIGRNATVNLDEVAEPVVPLVQARVPVPSGRALLRCGMHIHQHFEDWRERCGKREFSMRGCICVPFKPPAPPPVAAGPSVSFEQRLSFGGDS